MKVLIACEYSGRVRDAFTALGHEAWSCDLLPTDIPGLHHQGDVIEFIKNNPSWDLMIAHPPCTYLASSGLHWNGRILGRNQLTLDSLEFVKTLLNAPIARIVLENPIGRINTAIRKPDQIIQPWMFGEDASKSTCLWLKGVNKLEPTDVIKKDRYANQTPSGQNNLGPSKDRWKIRSTTYQGIATAMAHQWGKNND
jgi:hypothetical protein